MLRRWVRAWVPKFLWGQPLQPRFCRAPRPRALLRLEALEERTVTATLDLQPPVLLAGPRWAVALYAETQPRAVVQAPAVNDTGNVRTLGGPSWERLLADLQTRPRGLLDVSRGGTSTLPRSEQGGSRDALTGPASPSTSRPWPIAANVIARSDPQRPGSSGAPFNPTGTGSNLGKDVDRTDLDPNNPEAHSADPPGLWTVDPAAPEARAVPTDLARGFLRPGGGNQAFTQPMGASDLADPIPALEDVDLADSAANGLGPRPRPHTAFVPTAVENEIEPATVDVPDGALLQRFVVEQEQAAFTALVQRYEPLVFGVCRRVLGEADAAEDALQATFVVLARKASMLDGQRPLAGWLYQVAYHLALRLRAVAARRRRCEQDAVNHPAFRTTTEPSSNLEHEELRQTLLEELQRLPEKYRAPLVLCYFEGRTHEQAARALGLPRGSMAKRIREGLERLRERLHHRGFLR